MFATNASTIFDPAASETCSVMVEDEWDLNAIVDILSDLEEAKDYLPVASNLMQVAPTGASTEVEPPSVIANRVSQFVLPASWKRGIDLCLNPKCQAVLPHPESQHAIANRDGAVAHLNQTTGLSWEIQPPEDTSQNSTRRGHLRTENMTRQSSDGSLVYVFPWNGRQHRLCINCRPPNEPLLQPQTLALPLPPPPPLPAPLMSTLLPPLSSATLP